MTRDEQVEYEQDNLGNERKKLDTLRAQEGMTTGTREGLIEVGGADTGSVQPVYESPEHADEVIVNTVHAYNSVATGTVSLYDVQLDSNGTVTQSTRRSVPIGVNSAQTRRYEYEGEAFENSIGIESEFEGWIGVGVYSDHNEASEDLST